MSYCEVPVFNTLYILSHYKVIHNLWNTWYYQTNLDTGSKGNINGRFKKILIRVLYLYGKLRNAKFGVGFFSVYLVLGGVLSFKEGFFPLPTFLSEVFCLQHKCTLQVLENHQTYKCNRNLGKLCDRQTLICFVLSIAQRILRKASTFAI